MATSIVSASEIAIQLLHSYLAKGQVTKPLNEDKESVTFFQSPRGHLAIEQARGTRPKSGAKFWLSYEPKLPSDIRVESKLPGDGRNNKLAGSSLGEEFAVWTTLVSNRHAEKNSQIRIIISDFLDTDSNANGEREGSELPLRRIATSARSNTDDDRQEENENSPTPTNQYDADAKRDDTEEHLVDEVENASTQIDVEYANKPGEDVDAIVKRRIGQGPFRNLLAKKYGVSCCVSGLANKRLLIASHIVPWSKASSTQKTDPENGLLLSVSWDALFDKGFVSFDDDGKLICSEMLEKDTAQHLGVSMAAKLPVDMLTEERKKNLSWHRKNHGFET